MRNNLWASRQRISGELTQFGVNIATLAPKAWSADRHWHENEDEMVYVLSGELSLIDDHGETILRAGDKAVFKAGMPNGHHLVNQSDAPATYLEMGTSAKDDVVHYPDIDRHTVKSNGHEHITHKDGRPLKENSL